jgi:predicted dehydrogenase
MGMTHDHVWSNLDDVKRHSHATLVAAADPHQQLRDRVEAEFQAQSFSSYSSMVDDEKLDAVYIFADNAAGPELTEMAASRGLHVLIEKPMAANKDGAHWMLGSVKEANTRLMVNWPFAWWPQMQLAVRMALDGAIGDIWQVRYRAAHAGPRELGCSEFFCDWLFDPHRNGPGGAYVDYCCYGALLARVLMGMPTQVSAMGGRFVKTDQAVDDNAVLVMKYPHGMAISEGSWTQVGTLSAYMTVIYGTKGTLLVEPRGQGNLYLATTDCPAGERVDLPDFPKSMHDATSHFLHGIESGEPFWELCDPEQAHDAQVILQAGAESLAEGHVVAIT